MVSIREVAEDVFVCQSSAALVNCTVLVADDELVVIDTLLRPQDTREVRAFIDSLGIPMRWLVNTHWHSDHCYGNRLLIDSRTCVVAHADHLRTLERERYVLSPNRRKIVERQNLVMPHLTLRSQAELRRPVHAMLLPAPGHTPDSLAVWLPQRGILITGDTVLNSGDDRLATPYFYWGDSRALEKTLEMLLTLSPQMVIPGHGEVTDAGAIERGLRYVQCLRQRFAEFVAGSNENWEHYEMERSGILASQCLPGTREEDFWTPQMHGLNLQKLLLEHLGKESE